MDEERVGPFELGEFLAKRKKKHPWEETKEKYRWDGNL